MRAPLSREPIVAIATASGRGAIGIVRISGQGLAALATALCGRMLEPRHATLVSFLDRQGASIDRGLAIHFPAPHSYTGEDVLELQAHGGPIVMQLLLARCLEAAAEAAAEGGDSAKPRLPRLRLARPGEFTERAFSTTSSTWPGRGGGRLIDASTEPRRARRPARWMARSRARSGCSPRRSSSCASWSKRRSIFRRKRSSSSSVPARGDGWPRPRRRSSPCSRRRVREAAERRHPGRPGGQPNVGKSCCSTPWRAPSWRSSPTSPALPATRSARRSRSKACRCT